MKIKTTTLILLFPFFILGQECDYFPSDTLNICGYEYILEIALDEETINYNCSNDQYLSIAFENSETHLSFSSCGSYELIYNATDGSCIDTLLIQVSDPNSGSLDKSLDISLGYADIDCPGDQTANCYDNVVSISIGSGTPMPIWTFCSTTTCQSSIHIADTIGNVNGCIVDSIVTDVYTTISSSDYCSDDNQDAFIVLDSEGNTVTDNNFLEYIAQLQDTTDLDCFINSQSCSFTNNSTCHDSIVLDTTLHPIPVRIGGQWTMPMIDTLQLYDTTYFEYFGRDYELILAPGVDFYGPGELDVTLNEIFITSANDTTRQYPNGFYLSLQWEEEWILDTIQIIQEKYFDTNNDCFACGGFSYNSDFNVPEIPEFPCGPFGIYYPSICECEYNEPDYSLQMINCEPREWLFEIFSNDHYITYVNGAQADIAFNTAILSNPTSQFIDIETQDFYGCFYYSSVFIENYLFDFFTSGTGDLSCITESVTIEATGNFQFPGGTIDKSKIIWNTQQIGSSIIVTEQGSYTATYTDDYGCTYSSSTIVGYDYSVECFDENPLAETECNSLEMDIICDILTFDSFNYVMPSQESEGVQPPYLCNEEADNISWFSFVAHAGEFSIDVLPSNCSSSNDGQKGLEVGIYSDCSFSNSVFCSSECNESAVTIASDNLTEGQVYYMYIDGCGGSICNYSMEILGNPEAPSLAPESITLSANNQTFQNANSEDIQSFCLGTDINCKLNGVEIQGEYKWSVFTLEGEPHSQSSNSITEENDLWLTFDTKGSYEICIEEIKNGCDQFTWSDQMCLSVKVGNSEDEYFGVHYVCEGEINNFDSEILKSIDPNQDGTIGLQGDIQNYQIGINKLIVLDENGCEYEQEFEIENYPASDIPTELISECYSSLPIELNGTLFYESDFNNDKTLSFEYTVQEPNQNGCDSSINYTIVISHSPEFEINYPEYICYGEDYASIEFTIFDDDYTILIDGEVSGKTSEIASGTHDITVMNSNMCASYQSIYIEEIEEKALSIDGNLNVKEGEESTYVIDDIFLEELDPSTLTWSINGVDYCKGSACKSIQTNLTVDSEIELQAVTLEGCNMYTSIRVVVEEIDPKLVIPNIFSPNNDGVNDYWFVVPNKENITIENIKIIDRWNNLVYSQNKKESNSDLKWDGKLNGNNLQPGVYVYSISYSSNNNLETVYGDVTILK